MNQKVLVIEDDPDARKIISLVLKLDGFIVFAAPNGSEALRLVKDDPPDAVVLDVIMPGMDGYEVCRQIRSNPATLDMPIVILSSRVDEASIARGYEVGASNYLCKPIKPSVLNKALCDLLDGKAKAAHAPADGESGKHG